MKSLSLLVLSGLSLMLVAGLAAQDYDATQRALLNGTVLIAPGMSPPGRALVTLFSLTNIAIDQVSTNSSGSFSFRGITSGNFRIVVKLAGYEEASAEVSYRGNTVTTILPIYLNQDIQNKFNAPRVEIKSLHYTSLRDGTQTVIAESYLPKGFRLDAGKNVGRRKNEEPNFH